MEHFKLEFLVSADEYKLLLAYYDSLYSEGTKCIDAKEQLIDEGLVSSVALAAVNFRREEAGEVA